MQLYPGAWARDRVSFRNHSFYLIFGFLFTLEKEEEQRMPNEWTWLSRDKLCEGHPVESAVLEDINLDCLNCTFSEHASGLAWN